MGARDTVREPDTEFVRVGKLARHLGIPVHTLRRMADAEKIPSVRTDGGHRLFDPTAVRAALAASSSGTFGAAPIEDSLTFRVTDDGEGAFAHLRRGLSLADDFESISALTKGKQTTWRERHTGEGIFFTSKALDMFQVSSNGKRWTVDNVRRDQAVGVSEVTRGTDVVGQVDRHTDRSTRDVFQEYSEDLEFVRTRPVVKLFGFGLRFVSRSEARRLLNGLDEFTEIDVDFAGVQDVGQGFVDELLRVWPRGHPGKTINPINMNEAVEFMVRRGLRE